eukprot:864611-Pelagomonas_calceolata.AAC.4
MYPAQSGFLQCRAVSPAAAHPDKDWSVAYRPTSCAGGASRQFASYWIKQTGMRVQNYWDWVALKACKQ